MNNDYELRLVEKISVELNTLLNPIHLVRLDLDMSDFEKLESALDVLQNLISDD